MGSGWRWICGMTLVACAPRPAADPGASSIEATQWAFCVGERTERDRTSELQSRVTLWLDERGRTVKTVLWAGDREDVVVTTRYEGDLLVEETVLGDDWWAVRTEYVYDERDRLTREQRYPVETDQQGFFGWIDYSYDDLDQLISVVSDVDGDGRAERSHLTEWQDGRRVRTDSYDEHSTPYGYSRRQYADPAPGLDHTEYFGTSEGENRWFERRFDACSWLDFEASWTTDNGLGYRRTWVNRPDGQPLSEVWDGAGVQVTTWIYEEARLVEQVVDLDVDGDGIADQGSQVVIDWTCP